VTDRRHLAYPKTSRAVGWTALVAAALILGVLVPTLFNQNDGVLHSTAYALESAASGPVLEDHLAVIEVVRLERGQTVAGSFSRAGVGSNDVVRAVASLQEVIDLKKVRPSDTFLLYCSLEGELRRVEFDQRGADSRIVIEESDGTYVASVVQKAVSRSLRKIEGTVEDNLFFSIQRAGGNAALVVNFADLFAWDFDFFTETRKGDRFEILAEEKIVDGVPAGFGIIMAGRYLPAGASSALDAYYFAWNEGEESGYYTGKGRSVRKFFLKSPLNFRRISSHFSHSRFHPILKKHRPHLGIDYAAPSGTPVVALGNGRVVFRGWKGGYGRTVQIKHNQTYMSQYAHLSKFAVGQGVRVKQGQVIGYVGSSGLSTGPHLDFRVMEKGSWINPLRLNGGKSEPLPQKHRAAFEENVGRIEMVLERLEPGEAIQLPSLDRPDPVVALARLDTPSAS
jgi:murein DD-endopeptidase MepM/ murein hydrolase activator NlpD